MMMPHPHHLVSCDEVPPESTWLGARERAIEEGLVRSRRRREWRSGRWAAKGLVARLTGLEPEDYGRVEVIGGQDGAPRVWMDDCEAAMPISISHRGDWAVAATSSKRDAVGIDLELLEPRTERFVRDFFTDREVDHYLQLPPEARDLYAVATWSAKEGVLKCVRTGLRRDTRTVEIELDPVERIDEWQSFGANDLTADVHYEGWWVVRDGLVLTIVVPT